MNKRTLYLAILALLSITTLLVFSQTSSQFPEMDKNGRPVLPRPMPHLVYSPADLAHSGVTLPASIGGATPNTNIIRLGDATKMSVLVSCTQNVDLVVNVYTADDQSQSGPTFTLYNSYVIATGMAAGSQEAFLASELRPMLPVARSRFRFVCRSLRFLSLKRMTPQSPAPARIASSSATNS